MAEKTGELKSVDKLDPTATSAGAERDEFLERYAEDYSDSERREMDANTGDAPAETEHIKAQIEATRSQMGETIDAIQERLSFANISEQVSETVSNAIETAKDTAYDATIGKAVNFMKNVGNEVTHSNAFRTVKNNPFPLALIGIGAGLLVYQSYSGRSRRMGNGHDRQYLRQPQSEFGGQSDAGSSRNMIGNATHRAYDGITHTAESAVEGVKNVAGTAYESVTGALNNAYAGAGEITHRAYERAGEFGHLAHEKYDQYLEKNPLALGAVALAVGAAVGFAIPSTQYEGRLMGDAREDLMHRAQEAAGSLVDRAKQVASEAGQTIKQEAQALTE